MKQYLHIMLVALVLLAAMPAATEAKRQMVPKMYMFGFAASFNDTIVYFTDIQTVDSAWIEKKSGFLQSRNVYTSELRDYMARRLSMPHRTCVVFYGKKRSKVEKQYLKMMHKYGKQKDGSTPFDIRYITQDQFRFKAVDLSGLDEDEQAQKAADAVQEKAAKEAQKQKRRQEKTERKAVKSGK